MKSLIDSLAYVGATTSDIDRWSRYGDQVLGLERSSDSDESLLYLRADQRHHRLSIHRGDRDDISHVGWQVGSGDRMQAVAETLTKHGVEVRSGTPEEKSDRRVRDLIHFMCPHSEVRMEVCWGHQEIFLPRFRPPRDLTGFEMGDGGMGHVVLYAPDVVAASEFYRDVLGFGITDLTVPPGGSAPIGAFLHCNSRHHSLAFFGIPDAPRRLQHVMFQTSSLDDVGTTYDLCREHNMTTTSIGRHYNDRAVSFYFQNPSGWHFEFAWDPREIDPSVWRTEYYVPGGPGVAWGHEGLFQMV
ncbi:MAG TPA: VOC family protein [Mycobacterium sp.]|nr:VOC family protein [Mycobacterium sp.]